MEDIEEEIVAVTSKTVAETSTIEATIEAEEEAIEAEEDMAAKMVATATNSLGEVEEAEVAITIITTAVEVAGAKELATIQTSQEKQSTLILSKTPMLTCTSPGKDKDTKSPNQTLRIQTTLSSTTR